MINYIILFNKLLLSSTLSQVLWKHSKVLKNDVSIYFILEFSQFL